MITGDKIDIIIPDKYFKNSAEEPVIGFIKYLREQGKVCEFLGFHNKPDKLIGLAFSCWYNDYVILVDGIKYYGGVGGSPDPYYYANFFVVNDEEHDYIENYLNKRTSQILDALENNH
jgi:hypothetical protein